MTAPSLLILGTDAVLAAAPVTPVQLAHACLAAGFHAVIPATWGDELIAERVLDRLRDAGTPLVQCSCPLVARRLAARGSGIEPLTFSVAAPPVATAQYLRAIYAPTRPRITFAGGCAALGHESIDVWLSPEDLFGELADRGIVPQAQPTEFDSVLPPDRRRFFSDPGGVPSQASLDRLPIPVERRDLTPDDIVVDLAQWLLSDSRSLIDLAPALGCSCSGAVGGTRAEIARTRVREVEPPRSFAPIVDHTVSLSLEVDLPPEAPTPIAAPDLTSEPLPRPLPTPIQAPARAASAQSGDTPPDVAVATEAPRRTPPARHVFGVMPQTRTEVGRQLPRAYVARRRSSPRNVRQIEPTAQPASGTDSRPLKWVTIAAVGLAAGVVLTWLILAL